MYTLIFSLVSIKIVWKYRFYFRNKSAWFTMKENKRWIFVSVVYFYFFFFYFRYDPIINLSFTYIPTYHKSQCLSSVIIRIRTNFHWSPSKLSGTSSGNLRVRISHKAWQWLLLYLSNIKHQSDSTHLFSTESILFIYLMIKKKHFIVINHTSSSFDWSTDAQIIDRQIPQLCVIFILSSLSLSDHFEFDLFVYFSNGNQSNTRAYQRTSSMSIMSIDRSVRPAVSNDQINIDSIVVVEAEEDHLWTCSNWWINHRQIDHAFTSFLYIVKDTEVNLRYQILSMIIHC